MSTDEPDFETFHRSELGAGLSGWHWQAYHRDQLIDSGGARTRLGLAFALWRARRRLRRQIREAKRTDWVAVARELEAEVRDMDAERRRWEGTR